MSTTLPGPGWRADVRDVVARILKDRVALVQGRVHRARVWPVGRKPALLVYGYAEKKELRSGGGYQHQFAVTCNMVVRVLCEGAITLDGGSKIEAECEAVAGEVERAILRAPELWAPSGGILRQCSAVETEITAEQKAELAEVEATMQFSLAWDEIFTMAEPETSPCDGIDYRPSATLIPTP